MKYLVIAFCVILVALAIVIFIRNIRSSLKGKCCNGCDGCSMKGNCSKENINK